MKYHDLSDFCQQLEERGELKRVDHLLDPYLEITEFSYRTLRDEGPALLFTNPKNSTTPILTNLFGTTQRVALGMGFESTTQLRELGQQLAYLREPSPPQGLKDAILKLPLLKKAFDMHPRKVKTAPWQASVLTGQDVSLAELPIQTCWPGDAGPLITWGLVVTHHAQLNRLNLGIYRQQVIGRNRVIMRWLAHRGGALDFQYWQKQHPAQPFPVSVVLGACPATLLAAVCPIPDQLSEFNFAGLLRGARTELCQATHREHWLPTSAEIILEGYIYPDDTAIEGPFGDHTGYYNEQERFPVFTIERIFKRQSPIYHSTYTGRPPDEPAILGLALNELFVPLIQKQFPEIIDFYLPPEACSYRMAIISIRKQFVGHARQIMMGTWSFLKQFMYTKFVIVVDDDIDVRNWQDVMWALSTRMDPVRDVMQIENTPIDYLDFASPLSGLGGKIGLDATNKWPGETQREWGQPIQMNQDVRERIDKIYVTVPPSY